MSNVSSTTSFTLPSNPSGTSTSVPLTLTVNPTPSLTVSDENDIRTAILTTIQADFALQGVQVNILPGSDYYILATSIARWGATVEANAVIQVDNFMPDSTQDFVVLARWMAFYGLAPRPAAGSSGVITITSSAPSPIAVGDQLTDSLQQVYQVTQAGTYPSGSQVPISSISTGAGTNQINGQILTWVSAPTYCDNTATVGTTGANDGLVNGANAEDIETARARLLQTMSQPMGGGNWAQVAALGAASSGAVCGVAVYPGCNGPSTCHVACWGYATNISASNAKQRALSSALMTGTVATYIQGNVQEGTEFVVTTVQDTPIDVSIGMTIPSSPSASPPGPGGGWLDAQPWPYNSTGAAWPVGSPAGSFYCPVTSVYSSTAITVNAPSPPVPGVSSISFLDPSTWLLFNAHVLSYTGTSGAYVLLLDAPLVNIKAGSYIFPTAQNTTTYINAVLGAFANMGPGEKTNAAGLISRAYRHPTPQTLYPYAMGDVFLKSLTNSGPEVIASEFLFTTVTGWPSVTAPALPSAISNPPLLFGPRNIGLYSL